MSTAAAALRAAIHDALIADGALTSLLGGARIYDEPPRAANFPYVTLGEARVEEGTDFTCDGATGVVTFQPGHMPPEDAAVTAGFLFDVPVRFDTDYLEVDLAAFTAGAIPKIPLLEIKP
jgi:uncharacterized protein (TIGR02217 family)